MKYSLSLSIFVYSCTQILTDIAILKDLKNANNKCVAYNRQYTSLNSNHQKDTYTLIDLTPDDGCSSSNLLDINQVIKDTGMAANIGINLNTMIVLNRGNCRLVKRLINLYGKFKMTNLLVVYPSNNIKDGYNLWNQTELIQNKTLIDEFLSVGINLFIIKQRDFLDLKETLLNSEYNTSAISDKPNKTDKSKASRVLGQIRFNPLNIYYDMGPIILALIVICICIFGGYLGGRDYYKRLKTLNENATTMRIYEVNSTSSTNVASPANIDFDRVDRSQSVKSKLDNKSKLRDQADRDSFSVANVIFMVVFMCIFLTLIWYFYKYAVYYLIYVFCLYSIIALYSQFRFLSHRFLPFRDFSLLSFCNFRFLSETPLPSSPLASTNINYYSLNQPNSQNKNSSHITIADNDNIDKTNVTNSNPTPTMTAHDNNKKKQNYFDTTFVKVKNGICETFKFLCRELFTIKHLLCLVLSLAICIFWLVHRHEFNAFILQDIMGASLCLYILTTVHIPNLKIGTLLLSLLFIFDIFFVFITPFLTKSKTSIMIDILGGKDSFHSSDNVDLSSLLKISEKILSPNFTENSHYPPINSNKDEPNSRSTAEQIPLAFKMPYINVILLRTMKDPKFPCVEELEYEITSHVSYIGYGDVVMPGLLVAFCFFFDMVKIKRRPKHLYSVIVSLGYVFGLAATYLALFLMKQGQPALLYLVPFTLGPTAITALIRGEFKRMWNYHMYKDIETSHTLDNNFVNAIP
ncbi:signal peptide peptidase-like 2A isoform X1 [Gordionus sp. m RMFG-2023]|uniref:signal peptide peptidase-like 2A isoform X1 n=1 Tax=Gordionus sp. m RMFG-2023 TaxID=3053472 RepID=UPI0031FC3CFA